MSEKQKQEPSETQKQKLLASLIMLTRKVIKKNPELKELLNKFKMNLSLNKKLLAQSYPDTGDIEVGQYIGTALHYHENVILAILHHELNHILNDNYNYDAFFYSINKSNRFNPEEKLYLINALKRKSEIDADQVNPTYRKNLAQFIHKHMPKSNYFDTYPKKENRLSLLSRVKTPLHNDHVIKLNNFFSSHSHFNNRVFIAIYNPSRNKINIRFRYYKPGDRSLQKIITTKIIGLYDSFNKKMTGYKPTLKFGFASSKTSNSISDSGDENSFVEFYYPKTTLGYDGYSGYPQGVKPNYQR